MVFQLAGLPATREVPTGILERISRLRLAPGQTTLGAPALVEVTGLSRQGRYPKRAHGRWQAILDIHSWQGGYPMRAGHLSESDAS